MWYLYVLHCRDNSFYTGITTDVARRVAEHQAGVGARYTRAHLPVELLAAWQYPNRSVATHVEYKFKALTHKAKIAWIAGRQPFMDGPFACAVLDE
ncbi:MAG TPA: GIY-YIG nuclease family protein [Thermoflexia bacterium]|nr:GIY-YIG nuclease family protein [Thermoflexia bacterium]